MRVRGEARRILIARALVHDPQALMLDEPSNSLDLHATHELREIFRKLARAGIGQGAFPREEAMIRGLSAPRSVALIRRARDLPEIPEPASGVPGTALS